MSTATDILDDVRDGIRLMLAPFNVDQYRQMIRDGILRDGEPIELIEGTLVYKDRRDQSGGIMTHGGRHLNTLNRLTAILSRWVMGRTAFLQVQGPITLSHQSEPEPDCSLISGRLDDFRETIPNGNAVMAVFEVADSSLRMDRQTKQRIYSEASIPVYVIINLRDNVVEVYSAPSPNESSYATRTEYRRGETIQISLANAGDLTLLVDELL